MGLLTHNKKKKETKKETKKERKMNLYNNVKQL